MGISAVIIGSLLFSQGVSDGIIKGITLCGGLLIPTLFVFLCFCEWGCLSGTFQKVFSIFNPFFRLLLGRFYQGGTALLLCFLGGYPMGASALKNLEEKGCLSEKQIKLLSLWVFCPSPSFAITGVGMGMLGSLKAGVLLWGGCALSCVLTGFVLCRIVKVEEEKGRIIGDSFSLSDSFVAAVSNGVEKMLQICGVVILVAGILGGISVMPLPSVVQKSAELFLEVTNAASYLTQNSGSMAQIGAVLMFGGIGTHLQCKMLLGSSALSYPIYLLVRIIQTALCYFICNIFCKLFPWAVPTLSNGRIPTVGSFSIMPSLWLIGTCFVFLCSVHQMSFGRREKNEK